LRRPPDLLFVEEVRGDEPELASYPRIEEREPRGRGIATSTV
jgi:hypothetical protein